MADPNTERQTLAELDRLLASREFATAERASRFLKYAVERTLAGDREGLKESVIGTAVFDRPAGYDPKAEPIVRTEARRLRAKLEEFYSHTEHSQVRISIPKGSYVAAFEPVGNPVAMAGNPPPIGALVSNRRAWLLVAVAVLAGCGIVVWILHLGNQAAVPVLSTVTSFPGSQGYPTLSPDGKQVAFTWRREDEEVGHVYTANVDGSQPKRITETPEADTFPAWSPDGGRLAFVRQGQGITAANSHGGEERALTPAFPSFLVWSRDGERIFYCNWTSDGSRLAIFSVDLATGDHRQVSNPPAGLEGDVFADVSPDGSQLAFGRCHQTTCDLYAMPSTGGAARRIAEGEARFSGLAWNPDGRTIVISARRRGQYQLWKVNANGSGKPELVQIAGEEARFPNFGRSPSGQPRMVYEQHISDSNIWRTRLDTAGAAGEPHRIIASTRLDSSPQVSPDGRKIAFVSDRSGFEEIWTVDEDGENAAEVTRVRAQGAGSPRWSPDSRQLAFDVMNTGGRAIFLVNAGGGVPRQVSQAGSAGRPSWSRDGRWIYFGDHDEAGNDQIYRVSATDRQQRVQMTRDGGFEAFESIDGKSLFYIHNQELRRMPAGGGEPSPVTDRKIGMGMWSVAGTGVYFVDLTSARVAGAFARGSKTVDLLDPESGAVHRVSSIDGAMLTNLPDFSVSPDGKALYYSVLEVSVSQIRMVEGAF